MRTQLEEEVASCDVVEHDNQFLHSELKAVAETYEQLHKHYAREYENKKQYCFDTRMAMEQVLRDEIKNLDINFKTNAVILMDHEAEVANNENRELYAELHRREELSRELIANQQNTYDVLQKLQIEQEVMKTTAQSHEVGITELKDLVYSQHKYSRCFSCVLYVTKCRTISKLKEQLEKLQTSVSKHQTILTRKLAHSETLLELDTKLQSILKRKDHYKHRTLKCVGRLTDEIIAAVEDEQRQYTYDLVDMAPLASPRPASISPTSPQPATPPINPDAVWKCTLQPLPQLTGTLRTAMLHQINEKKTKTTKLPHVSVSMTHQR